MKVRRILLLVGALIAVPVAAQVVLQWKDYATLFGFTGSKYNICWTETPGPNGELAEWVQLRRSRVEGGVPEISPRYQRADWIDGPALNDYCLGEMSLPRSGHYAYEIQACLHVPAAGPNAATDVCSPWTSSLDPTHARVGGQPRAWWIYGHPAPPSDGGIDSDPGITAP